MHTTLIYVNNVANLSINVYLTTRTRESAVRSVKAVQFVIIIKITVNKIALVYLSWRAASPQIGLV